MKNIIVLALVAVSFIGIGCKKSINPPTNVPPTTLDQRARDGIAGATGFIAKAQTQYQTKCVADPTMKTCLTINKAIDSQNLAITALRTYCGFKPSDSLDSICTPVASSADALTAALSNLSQIIRDVKGVIK